MKRIPTPVRNIAIYSLTWKLYFKLHYIMYQETDRRKYGYISQKRQIC